MIRFIQPVALIALLLVLLSPPATGNAKSFYKQGEEAEARQNYEAAYDSYKRAYELKPKDLAYHFAYERMSFLAGASCVHRGQLLRDEGRLEEALAQFHKGLQIDPSSFIAQQEILRTQQMIDSAKEGPPQAAPASGPLKKMIEEAAGPIQLSPLTKVPITLKLAEDSKLTYETVGKLAGINVLFDPDYTSKRIRIELNGVTLADALRIIALESKTFWQPMTPNTIFVVSDTPTKRKEIEQNVIKIFYLAHASTPQEGQDMVNAMRQILEIARIQQLPAQKAILVRGTPAQIALAGKLIDDLDKSQPEVVVEVAIMQVNRDKLYQYGVNVPTSTTLSLQPTTTTGSTTGGSSPGSINLNRLRNLNASDFQATISSATATLLFSNSDSKILQNPQIRALDGQKASLKIGERVPVATGSFQPGIGGVGINPLVNTQFQYLDVGVNIDITPYVHPGREVTLKLSMDVSSVDSFQNIGGITQPVIGQRRIEHEISLKEGEVNLLGGMFEDQQTKSLTGIPGLAKIPLFKYLFSQTNTDHRQNELVFLLLPHIVRGQEVNMDDRLIDVGTGNGIELRQVTAEAATPTAPTQTPPQTKATQSQPGAPPATLPRQAPPLQPLATEPGNPAGARSDTFPQPGGAKPQPGADSPAATLPGRAAFALDPPNTNVTVGSTFAINILLTGAQDVYSVPVQINYDPSKLQVVNVSDGGLLSQGGYVVALVHRDNPTTGTLQVTATRPPGSGGISGQGGLMTLTFMAKASGKSSLSTKGGALDVGLQPIAVSGAEATVNVQ
jgi:general secretion pathway protein D